MINTVIFDLGGVIVIEKSDFWREAANKIASRFGIDPSDVGERFGENMNAVQTGKIDLSQMYENLIKGLEISGVSAKELLDQHMEIYEKDSGNFDQEMLDFIGILRTKYRVHCLTNTEPDIATLNRKKGIFDYFDESFISSDMGLRKPDSEIYESVLRKVNVNAEETVFIDNKLENVEAAEKVGMKGIQFKGIDDLKKKFIELGVIEEVKK